MSGRIALVLAGGAARGAYEVGVVSYLLEALPRDFGRAVPIDILSGTSVGAINASMLAAYAHEPSRRASRLTDYWTKLRISDMLRPDDRGLLAAAYGFLGGSTRLRESDARRGGILDPSGIERIVKEAIPFERIGDNIRAGHLDALTLSATHVGSGRTTVFIEQGSRIGTCDATDPTIVGVPVNVRAEHALASAAIPFLFPAVKIDGDFYTDGGLRQNVPLSPPLRLGATGIIVVNPRYVDPSPPFAVEAEREASFPGPFFLLGKALNALLLDRIDNDLVQVQRINRMLEAGVRSYGPEFIGTLNRELGGPPGELGLRPVRTALISASKDIGVMAGEYVRSPLFAKRTRGLVSRVMRRIADATDEADLLSYLLFDGEFAARLIELGRSDAKARHAELAALVAERLDGKVAA
jgi:NTE family protein